jgi:hypothetical protein
LNGRHTLKFKERLALDVWYVDNWSVLLDLKILAMTAWQVLRRSDVVAAQDVADIGFPLGETPPDLAGDSGARAKAARASRR